MKVPVTGNVLLQALLLFLFEVGREVAREMFSVCHDFNFLAYKPDTNLTFFRAIYAA